jgi:lipopolysaccharide/colanic/teichoic acid biosynthesis glycosyltransferase
MIRRGPAPGAAAEGLAGFYASRGKRIFDLIFSLVVLAVSMPLLVVAAVLLWVANRGEPFFTQTRPGKNEKPFRLVKFRTMNVRTDAKGQLLPEKQRITKLGNLLRKTSLDELPQLFNVIKGDMSIVGPRPLLTEYLDFYTEKERRRHLVRPGMTGWAQVKGRNFLSWDERLAKDVEYVETLSLSLDLRIFLQSLVTLFKFKQVAVPGTVSRPLNVVRSEMNPLAGGDKPARAKRK